MTPVEVHHRLTRSRGGLILDKAGEIYHLMALCRTHHKIAHEMSNPYGAGMMIEGYVVTIDGKPRYTGSDPYLQKQFP